MFWIVTLLMTKANRLDWCHIIECVDNIATLARARERVCRLNATNNN